MSERCLQTDLIKRLFLYILDAAVILRAIIRDLFYCPPILIHFLPEEFDALYHGMFGISGIYYYLFTISEDALTSRLV